MEESLRKYTREHLQSLSYRILQKMAKSFNLPSNVKKVYLVELINAKKFKTEVELEEIIHNVKLERQQQSQSKKGKRRSYVQGSEITSTNQSPPITSTPKRSSGIVIRCSPDLQQSIIKYQPNQSLLHNSLRTYSPSKKSVGSDRVLRSFRDRPSYRFLNLNNTVIGVIKARSPETRINIYSRGRTSPKFSVTAVVKKHMAVSNVVSESESQLVKKSSTLPAKRHRAISGIYPLATPEKSRANFTPTVNFTRSDGSLSKIKALVHKPPTQLNFNRHKSQHNITVQDLINGKIDNQASIASKCTMTVSDLRNSIQSSMVSDLVQHNTKEPNSYQIDIPAVQVQDISKENAMDGRYSVYYHKKIRAEQVRTQKINTQVPKCSASVEGLPKINDVFSKFNDVYRRNLSQPIYVQVNEESERTENYPTFTQRPNDTNSSLLETVYNFKGQFITNQPLLQIATTANTTCVYSTPIMTSAMPQLPATVVSNEYNTTCLLDNQNANCDFEVMYPIHDCLRIDQDASIRRDFMCNEVLRASSSSLETVNSQDFGASVTIPEMVEDALEFISQDGDYMERIGMDVRMQCLLCSWAGPKFILEQHIRKEHSSVIHKCEGREWNMTYTLGSLVQREVWLCRVVEHQRALYVLSAKYQDPDCFMAAVNNFSTDEDSPKCGRMTIYNKVTGEPYTWEGEIQELSHTMPYQNETNCFQIELSKLNLLPNSANLELLNRELVIKTPTKVVVGQPELNDIHIILFVKVS